MHELASKIRGNLDELAGDYERLLLGIAGYSDMPEQAITEMARNAIQLVAAGLETGDQAQFVQFIQSVAAKRMAQGLEIDHKQQALTALVEVIEPLLATLEDANFLWRGVIQAHTALSQMAMEKVVTSEEELRRLSQAVEATHDGVVITDATGRIRFVNRAFREMTGYSQAEVLGQNPRFLKSGRQSDELYAGMWRAITAGQVWQGEMTNRRKDGMLYEVQMTISPMRNAAGEIEQFVAVQRDVTERKRLELAMRASLERRGRQVQTSTEVAQEVASATALDELYRRVVVLIKERFDYYHAQIFRYEPALGVVVLVTSYGEAGKALLAEGHRLVMGRGVVGVSAAIGRPVLAADVTRDRDWVPNPHLPETKGELAVPIKLGDEVLGILDVQSETAGALTEEDQLLLEGLCGQIAIAIESTRLRQEMEDNLRELKHITRTMSREGWEAFRREAGPVGYLFDQTDVVPASDFWTPEVGLAVERKALVPPTYDDLPVAVAPLSVRGGIIGALGVQDDLQSPLSEEDLALVEEVSEQVALALESARLFEQTQAALAETEALYRGSERVIRSATMEDVLRALVDSTALQLLARANLVLFDRPVLPGEHPGTMTVVAAWERDDREPRVPVGTGYTPDQLAGGLPLFREKPTIVADVAVDGRVAASLRDMLMRQMDVRSLGYWPLVVGEQWIGAFTGQGEAPLGMNQDEVRQISSLVDQAAIVVQGMSLVAESQTRALREQALREITTVVSASQDMVASLPHVAEQLRQLIPLDLLTLAAYTPGDLEYTLFAISIDAETGQLVRPPVRLPVEGTCSGWAITHREPRLEADISREMLFSEDEQLVAEGITSRVLLPLLVGERVVGAMGLASRQPDAFTQGHLPPLSQVADQVALALERARLLEETRRALAEAETTHRTYLQRGWRDYLRQQELLRQGGFLYDRTADATVPDGLTRPVADLWRPEMEYALTKGLPATTGDGDGEEKRTGLAIPIVLRGQTIGVLGVEDPEGTHRWSEEDQAVIEAVSRQLAQALENARLLGETQLRAQRERIIGDVTGRVRASMDLEGILQTTVRELGVALGTDRAFIRLGARSSEELK